MEAADVHDRKTFGRYFLEKKQAEGLSSPKKSLDISPFLTASFSYEWTTQEVTSFGR